MKIIIAGAGAVGTHLAKLLSREKQDIILMDDNEERLSTLSSNFDLMTVTASPTSIQGLKEVGAKEADLFIHHNQSMTKLVDYIPPLEWLTRNAK